MNIGPIEITAYGPLVFWREGKPCAHVRREAPAETFCLYEYDTDNVAKGLDFRRAIIGAVSTAMTFGGLPDQSVDAVIDAIGEARDSLAALRKMIE